MLFTHVRKNPRCSSLDITWHSSEGPNTCMFQIPRCPFPTNHSPWWIIKGCCEPLLYVHQGAVRTPNPGGIHRLNAQARGAPFGPFAALKGTDRSKRCGSQSAERRLRAHTCAHPYLASRWPCCCLLALAIWSDVNRDKWCQKKDPSKPSLRLPQPSPPTRIPVRKVCKFSEQEHCWMLELNITAH